MNAVPRRAVFDDLRVGMIVAAWQDDAPINVRAGRVQSLGTVGDVLAEIDTLNGTLFVHPKDGYEFVVLCDAPAPPVTVRREDYDALVGLVEMHMPNSYPSQRFVAVARALIDNADTGDTP